MSDTAADKAPKLPPVPNYTMQRVTRDTLDGPAEHLAVTFGEPMQSIMVKALNLGEQWDLAEITGNNAGNETWQNMAYTAAAVVQLGGIPVPPPRFDRGNLRKVLNRLGLDGMRAVSLALSGATSAIEDAPPKALTAEASAATVPNTAVLDTAKN